jgi:hypothetical protein
MESPGAVLSASAWVAGSALKGRQMAALPMERVAEAHERMEANRRTFAARTRGQPAPCSAAQRITPRVPPLKE